MAMFASIKQNLGCTVHIKNNITDKHMHQYDHTFIYNINAYLPQALE